MFKYSNGYRLFKKFYSLNKIWPINGLFIFVIAWITQSWQLNSGLYMAYNLTYVAFIILIRNKIENYSLSFTAFSIGALFLLGAPVIFENDFYRYIWEGKVLFNGFNPYTHAPLDESLTKVVYLDKNKVGFPDLATIYPPVSLFLFGLVSMFSTGSLLALKLLGVLNALLVYLIITWLLVKKVSKFHLALLFPLLGKEFINSVHVDLLAAFFVFYFLLNERLGHIKQLLFILLSFMTKIVGVFYLYTWFVKYRGMIGKTKTSLMLIFVLSMMGIYTVYILKLPSHSGSSVYLKHWVWNAGLFSHLWRLGIASETARLISYAAFCLSFLLVAYKGLRYQEIKKSTRAINNLLVIIFLCFCYMMPVFNSWYAIWLVVPALLTGNLWAILYSAFSFLSYTYYYDQSLVWPAEILNHMWFYPGILMAVKNIKVEMYAKL